MGNVPFREGWRVDNMNGEKDSRKDRQGRKDWDGEGVSFDLRQYFRLV